MDDATKEALALNARAAWKMASNWVMLAASVVFAAFLTLPTVCPVGEPACTTQAIVMSHLPLPPWALPLVAGIVGIVARIWPQQGIGVLADIFAVHRSPPKE